MVGYSGRGKQNRRTTGPIQQAYSMGGYPTTPRTSNTPTFVANATPILEHDDSELFMSFVNTRSLKDLLAYLLSLELDNTRLNSWQSFPDVFGMGQR